MKLLAKLTFLLFFSVNIGYSQEPQRLEHLDSIINVINNSTKGLRFVLSDTGINSELSEVGTTFFMNKYVILSNKKEDTIKLLTTTAQKHSTIIYTV